MSARATMTLGLAVGLVLLPAGARPVSPTMVKQPKSPPPAETLFDVLSDHLRHARADRRWRGPSRHEREALRAGFRRVVAGCDETSVGEVNRELGPFGFAVEFLPARFGPLVMIREREDQRTGRGLYVIRCDWPPGIDTPGTPVIIQAPHPFFDLHTGELVAKLFAEGPFLGAYWSSVHRYRATRDETPEAPIHPGDVAHQPGSAFQAATVGAALGHSEVRFVQLHGFSQATAETDVILSSGDRGLIPHGLGRNLSPSLGKVWLYGQDTGVLGATTNAQQKALNEAQPGRFVHVELALGVRRRLRRDPNLREELARALRAPWW